MRPIRALGLSVENMGAVTAGPVSVRWVTRGRAVMFLIRVLASIVCSMGSALVGLVSVRMDVPTTNARHLQMRNSWRIGTVVRAALVEMIINGDGVSKPEAIVLALVVLALKYARLDTQAWRT